MYLAANILAFSARLDNPPIDSDVTLSDREYATIILSLKDRRSSVRGASLLSRIAGLLFGTAMPNSMADPRLETLRRYCVLTRLDSDRTALAEENELLALGFTKAELEIVRTLVLRRSSEARYKSASRPEAPA